MKKGFVGFILLLLFVFVAFWGTYYAFKLTAKSPSRLTRDTASGIAKYPNAASWTTKDQKNVCFLAADACLQSTVIDFTADDAWNTIYFYYRNRMIQNGWQTKTSIVTSIPTSIIFTSYDNCSAILTQPKKSFLQKSLSKTAEFEYSFKITCP